MMLNLEMFIQDQLARVSRATTAKLTRLRLTSNEEHCQFYYNQQHKLAAVVSYGVLVLVITRFSTIWHYPFHRSHTSMPTLTLVDYPQLLAARTSINLFLVSLLPNKLELVWKDQRY